jgi:hypothetical protein
MTGAAVVYLLSLATSAVCAGLLLRAWSRSRARLLLWSALSFSMLALNSLFVVADMLIVPGVDLNWARQLTSLAAAGVLIYGFIWEVE